MEILHYSFILFRTRSRMTGWAVTDNQINVDPWSAKYKDTISRFLADMKLFLDVNFQSCKNLFDHWTLTRIYYIISSYQLLIFSWLTQCHHYGKNAPVGTSWILTHRLKSPVCESSWWLWRNHFGANHCADFSRNKLRRAMLLRPEPVS